MYVYTSDMIYIYIYIHICHILLKHTMCVLVGQPCSTLFDTLLEQPWAALYGEYEIFFRGILSYRFLSNFGPNCYRKAPNGVIIGGSYSQRPLVTSGPILV